jgi:hypothetical protein
MSTERTKGKALEAFIACKVEVDAMLARLAAFSDEHFGYAPDEIDWGYAGTLVSYAEPLKRITDAAFHEGEHQRDSHR